MNLSASTAHAYGDDAQHYDNVEDLVAKLISELAPVKSSLEDIYFELTGATGGPS